MSTTINTSSSLSAEEPPWTDITFDKAIGQLRNPQAKVLLDTIDKLRELRVGEIVQLPQIIVVGDQSSGKSSVLEAISSMKFPVHGALCTRFATELILRTEPEVKITASIQKASKPAFSKRHDGKQAETTEYHRTSFDKNELPDIISEASKCMGIGEGSIAFSKDILRVVLTGPHVPQLTLVDLPGIFHSETSEQTFQGKKIVDELINNYMQERNSIILMVVAANNQLANQSVMSLAKLHDPQSKRIVGVITKPDLVDGYANEKKYFDLCRGLEPAHKLPLGWHVLRNSSEQQRNSESHDRDREEQRFFQRGAWSSLPSADRGVESLRYKLSKVLLDHIKGSLPALVREIEESLNTRKEQLIRLGEPRSTLEEMRSFLLRIAVDFQRLAGDAVDGKYGHKFFGDLAASDRKLRARLLHMNCAFDATMLSKGATYDIQCDVESASDQDPDDGQTKDVLQEDEHNDLPDHLKHLIQSYRDEFSDPVPITRSAITSELENLASLNQGKELPGTPNADLAFRFFQKQAEPWRRIAEFHLKQVLDVSKNTVDCLFGCVVGEDRDTTEAILKGCADPFFERKSKLLTEKLQELLRPYMTGYSLALESEFRRRTLWNNPNRFLEALQDGCPELFNETEEWDPDKILKGIKETDRLCREYFGTEKLIHMMEVHYEMSHRTFTANVINLAVENCLMSDIPNILTPEEVVRMTEEELKDLASESSDVISKREFLQGQAKKLGEGLEICQRYQRRQVTAPSTFITGVAASERQRWPGPVPSTQQASTTSQTASRHQVPTPFLQASLEDFPVTAIPFSNMPAVMTPPATPESRAKGGTPGASSTKKGGTSNNPARGNTLDPESHSSRSFKQRERSNHRKRSGSSSSEL